MWKKNCIKFQNIWPIEAKVMAWKSHICSFLKLIKITWSDCLLWSNTICKNFLTFVQRKMKLEYGKHQPMGRGITIPTFVHYHDNKWLFQPIMVLSYRKLFCFYINRKFSLVIYLSLYIVEKLSNFERLLTYNNYKKVDRCTGDGKCLLKKPMMGL